MMAALHFTKRAYYACILRGATVRVSKHACTWLYGIAGKYLRYAKHAYACGVRRGSHRVRASDGPQKRCSQISPQNLHYGTSPASINLADAACTLYLTCCGDMRRRGLLAASRPKWNMAVLMSRRVYPSSKTASPALMSLARDR